MITLHHGYEAYRPDRDGEVCVETDLGPHCPRLWFTRADLEAMLAMYETPGEKPDRDVTYRAWQALDDIMVEHGMDKKAQPEQAQAWLRGRLEEAAKAIKAPAKVRFACHWGLGQGEDPDPSVVCLLDLLDSRFARICSASGADTREQCPYWRMVDGAKGGGE